MTADKTPPDDETTWSHIQTDLKKALNAWETLSESSCHGLGPDQEKLEQIKKILKDITLQIEDLK